VSFTPDAPGTYHWVASYNGDSPNTLGASHNAACDDAGEDVVVRQIPTAISTAQKVFPNDSATITSSVAGNNLPSGGTVIFRLYGPTSGSTSFANCQLTAIPSATGAFCTRRTRPSWAATTPRR
jgi:hypothetical protein